MPRPLSRAAGAVTDGRVGTGGATVKVRTTWDGAGGIGGFFERIFAPKGLGRVYVDLLHRLDAELAAG